MLIMAKKNVKDIRAIVNNVKLLFLDVDNTALCLKMYDNKGINDKETGSRIMGVFDEKDWLSYNINNNAYQYCVAPIPLHNLVQYLHKRGVKIYGPTESKNSFEYNAKYNRLRECYEDNFQHHGDLIMVHTRHDKVFVMQEMAKKEDIPLSQVMFIDESYFAIMESF